MLVFCAASYGNGERRKKQETNTDYELDTKGRRKNRKRGRYQIS